MFMVCALVLPILLTLNSGTTSPEVAPVVSGFS